ncbi:MAG: LamG-like jellyroll fold domain-containing protein [Saprospiraceae bacterium]|nr:LamG-like jellyroll fold domain-containing protein [Saprospiraceae bacterium]
MKNFNTNHDGENPTLRKYRWMWVILTLFALFFAGGVKAQGPCSGISFSFDHYEPCKFRAQYDNSTDCFIEIRYILESGTFSTWDVNIAAGFTVDVISASELWVHHVNGFLPLGDQVPLLFTLPPDLNTTMFIAYLDDCAQLGCEVFGGILIESCPDPQDASIIGVKYRECGSLPYFNQPLLPDWTIQLLNADSNVIAEQVTDADGNYAFYDLPHGVYIVKELSQPGWSPSVPASGKYTVDLAPSQQAKRNFGNCPTCSCDDIYMDVVQLPVSSDTCAYILNVSNNDDYCFNEINLKLAAGSFASITPAAGWTATFVSPQQYKLTYPPNYIPAQSFQSTFFKVTGAAQHDITVSTTWNNNGMLVTCSRPFSYQCPPPVSPPPCCPQGSSFGTELVENGDFSLGNQDFTNDYNYFNPGSPTAIGSYSVLDYSQVYTANNQWASIDHTTYTTSGLMLIVDGYGGSIAWEQTVNVTAGSTYAYSAWFNNLVIPTKNYDDPQMALFVGSTQVAVSAVLAESPDKWIWLCGIWTATTTGPVVLSIRMLATADIGNDVAIDDISFRECIPPPPCQVSINVTQNPDCTVTICAVTTGPQPVAYQWCDGRTDACFTTAQTPCVPTTYCVTATCSDGATSSATVVYTIQDITPPVAVCNLGIGIDLGAACTFQVTPAFVDGGSTDNCGIQSMSVSPAVLAACTISIVTLTVTDWCGNTSTCTMGIQTAEGVPPLMTCPANTTVNGVVGPTGLCTATFSPVPPVAFDNCDPSVTVTYIAPPVLVQGPNTITWTATDDCGNETICTQIVTVQCGCDCPNNLVTNGSFENGTAGFPNALNQINQCSGWYAANNAPPSNNIGDWYSYPSFPGFYFNITNTPLPAHCGEKYAGFFLNTCEGITTQLSQTIQQGCSYEVGFWWTPATTPTAPFSFYAVMSGGNCTMYHPSGSCSHQCNGDQHVIVNATPSHLAGTWYYHSMTITNAYPNVGYMTFTAAQGAPNVNNYIFVDDVCVKKIAEPCSVTASIVCYPENPIAYTAQATLGCGSVVTQVDWYFDGNGPSSSCCLNSILHPFTTIGWHTVCLVVTASNDGGHTICKDTICKEVFIDHVPPTKCEKVLMNWQKLHTVDFLCCYALQLDNLEPDCFTQIDLTLNSGTFANASITLGWTVIGNLNSNHIILEPIGGGFLPTGYFSPLALCNPGGTGPYNLTVNLLYGLPPSVEKCEKNFPFDCPDIPIDSCCLDYDLFCQNVMNAVNVTVDNANCKATLNIGNLPPCDYIEWVNWGDQNQSFGPFVAGDMPMHSYTQSGTYVIQYLAIEVNPHTGLICFEKILTETIVVECDTCYCGSFSNLFIRPNSGPSIAVACGGPAPTITCPPNGQNLPITGTFLCQGNNCPPSTTVDWMLFDPSGAMVVSVTGVQADPNFGISVPANLLNQPGVYCVKLVGYCDGKPCPPCLIKFLLETPCDTCCKDYDKFLAIAQNVQLFGTLGDCTLSFQATGLNDCMQISYDWGDGSGTQGPFVDNTLVTHTYPATGTYYVCYTIEEVNASGVVCWEYTHCDSVYVICDTCCKDEQAFLIAATAVQTNAVFGNCTISVNGTNMDDCLQITWDWGDGSPVEGPYPNNTPLSHNYSSPGLYTVCYTVQEVNAFGVVCWEAPFCLDHQVQCFSLCPDCPDNLVLNPGFFDGALPGDLGNPGASNNWTVASGSPQVATNVFCCDPVSMQMWGNQDLGEAICQSGFAFDPAKTYSISFSAQFYQPGLPTPYVRFGFTAANACIDPFTCTTLCENIGESSSITNQSCATYTLPNWKPTANWSNLIIRAFNNVPNVIGDPTTISWGRIDNICIEEVDCATPPVGMVAWWPMDELLGDDNVADIVHFHEGDPKPNGFVGISDGPDPVAGKVNGALHFVGVPGAYYVEVSDDPGLNFGTGDFSIDAWVNTDMGTQTEPIVDKLGNLNSGYSLSIQGSSPYYLTLVLGNGSPVDVLQGPPINKNEWNFVAVAVSSQSATFYVGNSSSATLQQSTVPINSGYNATNTRPLLIGNNPFNQHWNIMIDELEIFNRAINPAEVNAIWNAGSFGKCKTIVAVDDPKQEQQRIRIFPNPNSGTFSVELSEAGTPGMSFRIIGLTGQVLREQSAQTGVKMQTVQAGDLPAGLYFLQVVSDGKILAVEKFVKQ